MKSGVKNLILVRGRRGCYNPKAAVLNHIYINRRLLRFDFSSCVLGGAFLCVRREAPEIFVVAYEWCACVCAGAVSVAHTQTHILHHTSSTYYYIIPALLLNI